MPKLTFYRLMPFDIDFPDKCPRCGADFHAPMRGAAHGALSVNPRTGVERDTRPGPLVPSEFGVFEFGPARLNSTSMDGYDGDHFSSDYSRPYLVRMECGRCHWAVSPDEEPNSFSPRDLARFWSRMHELMVKETMRLDLPNRVGFWNEIHRQVTKMLVYLDRRLGAR